MKRLTVITILLSTVIGLRAQHTYLINADSTRLTGCDSNELIIENHTQNVPGFLFNTGRGRTIFKKATQKLNDSTYLIGADTLTLNTNAWKQGGNSFHATGILGTLDTNHLDLYTHGLERARLTNTGHLLLGTNTDNGDLLNVNGNVGIGSATVTSAGNLIGTNAILFNHFISENHGITSVDPYIGRLQNVLFDYRHRLITNTSTDSNGVMTVDIAFPGSEIDSVYGGITYGQGKVALSFWNNGVPKSISVMLRSISGTWYGPFSSSTNVSTTGAGFFEVPVNRSYIVEVKATITPSAPNAFINLIDFEYATIFDVSSGIVGGEPTVGKYGDEHLYYNLFFRGGGTNNIRLSPLAGTASYFLNNVLIGGTTDNGTKLQVTGNTSISGTLKIAGLTNNNTQSRILVSDNNGNLFYRDASTLATNELIRSSLAVNGPIRAQQLILSAHDWPDYVFDSAYRLLPLPHLEKYIQQNNHLPGIPSAATAENNGTDVGETQTALLKKIEELTLYAIGQDKKLTDQGRKLIDQDKTLNEQNKKLSEQENEIQSLKKKMEQLEQMINTGSKSKE